MTTDDAITIAYGCAAWMAQTDDMLRHFLGASGMDAATLKQTLADPEVLGSVLDFVLQEDAWVVGCSDHIGCAPTDIALARQVLPGGQQPNWT